jgi:hypothetical protein
MGKAFGGKREEELVQITESKWTAFLEEWGKEGRMGEGADGFGWSHSESIRGNGEDVLFG